MSNPVATVFVDADNTLWDTDRVYADAQLRLLARAERLIGTQLVADDRLAFVRSIDQRIAETHHAGLRYPPRLLAGALALALSGRSPELAAETAWTNPALVAPLGMDVVAAEEQFVEDIRRRPELRPGVANGMNRLRRAGCAIAVFTEGSRARCVTLLEQYGLREHVDQVIEGPKLITTFRRLARLAAGSRAAFVVGDQLDRDIAPAKAAGFQTIYFPGGFAPKWTPNEQSVAPDCRVSTFEEAAGYILERIASIEAPTKVLTAAPSQR